MWKNSADFGGFCTYFRVWKTLPFIIFPSSNKSMSRFLILFSWTNKMEANSYTLTLFPILAFLDFFWSVQFHRNWFTENVSPKFFFTENASSFEMMIAGRLKGLTKIYLSSLILCWTQITFFPIIKVSLQFLIKGISSIMRLIQII